MENIKTSIVLNIKDWRESADAVISNSQISFTESDNDGISGIDGTMKIK